MRVALICTPGFEDALAEEAGRPLEVRAPGVALGEVADPGASDLTFARQVLPEAEEVRGRSVAQLARGALERVLPRLDGPFRLDAGAPDGSPLGARAALVAEVLLGELKERRRRVHRARTEDPAAPRLQLLLVAEDALLVSLATPAPLPRGGLWPGPFALGRAPVAADPRAPSSAYRKLLEALAWLGRDLAPGQRCVDLGAAPGGWSHVALARGARVVAVDRAELAPELLRHPRLEHVRRDAFSYAPPAPVDWLLCDVIAEPQRSLALLDRWVAEGWCDNLVFHLKFKGRGAYAPAFRALEGAPFAVVRQKHLVHDKNEVTLMAAGRDRAPRAGTPPAPAGRCRPTGAGRAG